MALLILWGSPFASAQEVERIELWSGRTMPNSRGIELQDSIANQRVWQVGQPALYRIAPTAEANRGIAVIICPGGGYQRYAWEVAGFDIARHLAKQGITGFVLTARLPQSPDVEHPAEVGVQDLQRALRLVRSRSEEWGIDKERVGVEGSSAGGHLAASAAILVEPLYEAEDQVDEERCTPDFQILVSPVISMSDALCHRGSRRALLGEEPAEEQILRFSLERGVTAETAPAILFHADDDRSVKCENSIRYYEALRAQGVSASLHIFPHGGHAISLEAQPAGTELWMPLAERWLDGLYGE